MKLKSGTELMNLPDYIKVGCEIELQNVNSKNLNEELKKHPELEGWKITIDHSVTDNGVEIVSPPISEKDPDVYKKFQNILDLAKACPYDKNRKVYVNERCGGHIHFDATKMRNNPKMMESFLRLWSESEELIYKMCNAKNDPIRKNAVKLSPIDGIKRMLLSGISEIIKAYDTAKIEGKSVIPKLPKALFLNGVKKGFQGYIVMGSAFFTPHGYAHPTGKLLKDVGKKSEYVYRVIPGKKGNKYKLNKSLRVLACHETGINMQHLITNRGIAEKFFNIGKGKPKNTYEFRNHNSSLDLDTWKQNIYLDSALSKIAYQMAYEQDTYKLEKKLSYFYEKGQTEEEKVDRFLDLLFDNDEDKKIYKERWESVKDAPVFNKAKGFSRTFLKSNAKKTKTNVIKDFMRGFFYKAKEENFISAVREYMTEDYGGR